MSITRDERDADRPEAPDEIPSTGRPRRGRGRARLITGAAAAGAVVAGLLTWQPWHHEAAAMSAPHADPSIRGTSVRVGGTDCGQGWSGGRTGLQRWALVNTDIAPVEVYLRDARTDRIYLDVENLGSGATRAAAATLGPGTYQFVCLPADKGTSYGHPHTLAGTTPAAVTAPTVPITSAELLVPLRQYHDWVARRLPRLLGQVRHLDRDVRVGDLGAARRDWLAGHRTYETLGAAYGAFGDFDTAINAAPGPRDPATDPQLFGFHKVEALLWSGAPAPVVGTYTRALAKAVLGLQRAFPSMSLRPIDIGLRAHEILEGSIQDELTGSTDAGSHTTLATIEANVAGTRAALRPLRPLLVGAGFTGLPAIDAALAHSRQVLDSHHHRAHWSPLASLSRSQRETLDATLEQTAELLSRVAVLTDPRKAL